MPTPISEARLIAADVRRVWGELSVEVGDRGQDWMFRITCPDGYRIALHRTPSDRNWKKATYDELNAHGFAEAKATWEQEEEDRRLARIKEDQRKNDERLEKAEARARQLHSIQRAAGPLAPQLADPTWIFTPQDYPETRRVLITPELAQRILDELNLHNRPLRSGRVDYWASIISRGRWRYTHQGIAFDTMGALQDGQHRLKAAVLENFSLDVNVSVGMPVENFGVIDTGANRSGADTAALLNKPNHNVLSGAVRLVMIYDRYGPETRLGLKNRVPNDELAEAIEKYGNELEDAVTRAQNIYALKDTPRMSQAALAAGIYLISRRLPEADPRLTEFLRGYEEGTSIAKGDVRLPLRSFMYNLRNNKDRRTVPVVDQLGVFIKAWNAWSRGRTMSILGLRRDETMPSVFLPPPVDESS
jgi:hypothetical protein